MNLYDALFALGNLGFDGPRQALYAIMVHSDWRERWDCTDIPSANRYLEPDELLAVFLINTWRNAKLSER